MRENILQRIEEIRNNNAGFTQSNYRWKGFEVNGVIISNVSKKDIANLNDVELLLLFERVIHKNYKQESFL